MVTPYAGVWIEIRKCKAVKRFFTSLPTRECGLKYYKKQSHNRLRQSLPTRECGLKSE